MADREVKLRFVVEDDGAIRVFDQAGTRLDALGDKADKTSGKLGNMGESFAKAGAVIGAAGAAAVAGITALGVSALHEADRVNELRQQLGLSARDLTEFGFSAKLNGGTLESFAQGVGFFNKALATGNPLLKTLGITSKDTHEALLQLSDVFRTLPDGPEKTAAAMALMGRSGRESIATLNDDLRGNAVLAKQLGVVYGDEVASQADKLFDTLDMVREGVRGLSLNIAVDLLPQLQAGATHMSEWTTANREFISSGVETFIAGPMLSALYQVTYTIDRTISGWNRLKALMSGNGDPGSSLPQITWADGNNPTTPTQWPGPSDRPSFPSDNPTADRERRLAAIRATVGNPDDIGATTAHHAKATSEHIKTSHEHERILKHDAEEVVRIFEQQNKAAFDLGASLTDSIKGALSSLLSRDGSFNIGDLLKAAGQKMAVDIGSGIIDGLSTGEAFTVKMPAMFERAAAQFGDAFEGVFGRVQSGAQETAAVASGAIRNAGGLGYALSVVPNADSSAGGIVSGVDAYGNRYTAPANNVAGLNAAASGISYSGAAAGPNYGGYAALAGSVLVGALGRNQSPLLNYGAQAGLLGYGVSTGALGASVGGVSAGAAGAGLGAIGAGLLVANFAQSISGPGHVEFKPGTGTAIGAAGGAASGAAIGTAAYPGIGTAIGAVVGAIAGALLSSFGTSGYTREKLRALGVEQMFKDSGILDAPGLAQTRSPGETVNLDKQARLIVEQGPGSALPGDVLFKLDGATAPGDVLRQNGKYIVPWRSQSLNTLEPAINSFGNVFAPSIGGSQFANAFLNTRQSFGEDRGEALTELDKIIAKLGITYKNALDSINQSLIDGTIPQANYLETIRDITSLVVRDLPPGVNASNIALSSMEEHQGRLTVNVERANQRLQDQVQLFQGLKDGLDGIAATGIGGILSGSTSARSTVFTSTQSLIMQTVQNLALDDFKQTPAYTGLTQSLAALVRGDAKAGAGVRGGLDALLSFAGAGSATANLVNYTFLPESLGSLRDQFSLSASAARRSILSPNRQRGALLGEIAAIDTQLNAILADNVVADTESGSFTSLLGRKGSLSADIIGLGGKRNIQLGSAILDQAAQQATKGINLVEQQNTLLSSLNITMQTLIDLVRAKGSLEDVIAAQDHHRNARGLRTAEARRVIAGR